jgi:hypothetical protein
LVKAIEKEKLKYLNEEVHFNIYKIKQIEKSKRSKIWSLIQTALTVRVLGQDMHDSTVQEICELISGIVYIYTWTGSK